MEIHEKEIYEKKVVFIDFDGTLVKTRSGDDFPSGIWDMELKMLTFRQLRKIKPVAIFIVSNQGGIAKGHVHPSLFQPKFVYVIAALQEYVGLHTFVAGQYCPEVDRDHPNRKPNPGMLSSMLDQFNKDQGFNLKEEDCVMIGDDHEGTDLGAAKNFGCDFINVNDFINMELPESLYRIVNMRDGKDFSAELFEKEQAEELVRKYNSELSDPEDMIAEVPVKWMVPKSVVGGEPEPEKIKKVVQMKPKG